MSCSAAGAHNRIRTDDLTLTKGVLCQLSYVGQTIRGGTRAEAFVASGTHRGC